MQRGDVTLFNTVDGGDIAITDGLLLMGGGLETAAYLSLFGGNELDDGITEDGAQWWGNLAETEPAKKYRSRTQNLLRSIPATSTNLRRVEDAAAADLQWFLDDGVATAVSVSATIPALNRVRIAVQITADGLDQNFAYIENWKAEQ